MKRGSFVISSTVFSPFEKHFCRVVMNGCKIGALIWTRERHSDHVYIADTFVTWHCIFSFKERIGIGIVIVAISTIASLHDIC